MRSALLVVLVIALAAGTVCASRPSDPSRRADHVMRPIVDIGRPSFESFEVSVPPPGWSAIVNNPHTWVADTQTPIDGLQYASCFYDDSYSGIQNEWICTKYVIEPGDECLSFYALGSTYWAITPYQNYNIYVTVDGDTLWNYVDDNAAAVSYEWQWYQVSLAAYSVGDTVDICFGYRGFDGAEASFDAIDIGSCELAPTGCCPLVSVCDTLDFNVNDCEYQTAPCGGASIWTWAVPSGIPTTACDGTTVTHVLGTASLRYPINAGEVATVGPLAITEDCSCLELCHYYDIDNRFDGGNLKVSADGGATWQLIVPFGGYDDVLDSEFYIARCVWGEMVFTGDSGGFVTDCFDLSPFIGEDLIVRFCFGSDHYATADLGWYIKSVRLGSSDDTAVRPTSWGAIKAMYR